MYNLDPCNLLHEYVSQHYNKNNTALQALDRKVWVSQISWYVHYSVQYTAAVIRDGILDFN